MDIHQYLSQFSGESVCFYPNSGNAGDAAIALSTYQLFRKHNIRFRTFHFDGSFKNQIVFYGGGGGFNSNYPFVGERILRIYREAKRFVIFPQTIDSDSEVLATFGSNVDVFCREKVSYDHVKRSVTKANVYLTKDLAFYLNLAELPLLTQKNTKMLNVVQLEHRLNLMRSTLSSLERIRFLILDLVGIFKHLSKRQLGKILEKQTRPMSQYQNAVYPHGQDTSSSSVLNCFRTDFAERTSVRLPPDNFDVVELFALTRFLDESMSALMSNLLIREIDRYDIINTNRLHVCILGILLNKKINLYGNNFYKIRAIFEHSIRDVYSNVVWKSDSELPIGC